MRKVLVQTHTDDVPFECDLLWESAPDPECDTFVHLAEADDGTIYLSTALFASPGVCHSVPVTDDDLSDLYELLIDFWETTDPADLDDPAECEED